VILGKNSTISDIQGKQKKKYKNPIRWIPANCHVSVEICPARA